MNPLIVDLSKTPEIHPSVNLVADMDDSRYDAWKFSLIGHLDFVHLKFSDAATSLRNQWKLKDKYQLIPLGKGFFTIRLSNIEDKNYITTGTWEVHDQILRVGNWSPNFRPESQRTSKAMVWVQFPGLSLEYWDEATLFTISRAIGTPIKVDDASLQYQSGYYAKVLIEIDLSKTIPNKLWIITKFGAFSQRVILIKLPKFCTKCKIVGHLTSECRATQQQGSFVPTEREILIEQNHTSQKLQATQQANQGTSTSNSGKPPTQNNVELDKPFQDNNVEHITEVNTISPVLESINQSPGINITINPFEVLQENENDLSDSEDGEIKEVSASNVLEFATIPQKITIIPKSAQSSDEVSSSKNAKKKPPLKPAVTTRKSSKESLKHMIDKGSISPPPPPFK
ncbi:uncharacterized protein LOC113305562 [Papaver somniferum]|uniref:uncharacterized protein LOC113305562 n=1 Tax=Papaver somniferum TaxID=3469 RepID=UPI000E6FC1E3|nr:uncharacterized protein LOC113305562 [Papaver somniferum]